MSDDQSRTTQASWRDGTFVDWLRDSGYECVRLYSGQKRYAAIMPLLYTAAIVVGKVGDTNSYDDRWCYHSREEARIALDAWDGVGEPKGWHRHPASGRRITKDGEAELAY